VREYRSETCQQYMIGNTEFLRQSCQWLSLRALAQDYEAHLRRYGNHLGERSE
jgi:hypothetical protein